MGSDLHMHTSVSDGRLSPEELVEAAKRAGLCYVAITDHDSVDALLQLGSAGLYPNAAVEIFSGIEFSTDMAGYEVHILGYGIDLYFPELQKCLTAVVAHRRRRFETMLERLQERGYAISEEEVRTMVGDSKSIGRAHIAQLLVRKGYFDRLGDAFADVLHKDGSVYVPHYHLTPTDIIRLIRAAGGVAIAAHPGQIGSDDIVEQLIELGIDGLEVFHPKHDAAQTGAYEALARRRGLLITGGSDYHAILTRYPANLGEFTIDDQYAVLLREAMRCRAAQR